MSVFAWPHEHAANPPETWHVFYVTQRVWHLRTELGVTLDVFTTKREAQEAIESGFIRRLYDDETRWYAGEPVNGWKPWAVCLDERRRLAERWPDSQGAAEYRAAMAAMGAPA